MKQYKIKLLTQNGIVEEIIAENEVDQKTEEFKSKYPGPWIMLSSTLI